MVLYKVEIPYYGLKLKYTADINTDVVKLQYSLNLTYIIEPYNEPELFFQILETF